LVDWLAGMKERSADVQEHGFEHGGNILRAERFVRYANLEVMQRAVIRYLRGESEERILEELVSADIRIPPTLLVWAHLPGMVDRVGDETGWPPSEYAERLSAVVRQQPT
jgi:hypothetical protein